MSPNSVAGDSTPRLRLPAAASTGTKRPGQLNKTAATRNVNFVTKTEDGVYKAAGFAREEAKTIEGVAENVVKFSTTVESDVDKVQTFVHQVHLTTQSVEADVDQATANLPDGSPHTDQVARKPDMANDFLNFGWGWNAFRIFLVVLTFVVVLLHNMGNVDWKLIDNDSAQQQTGGSYQTSTFAAFNMLLINLGPIWRALRFVKKVLTREEKIFAEVEENVDEAARDVRKTVETVEEIAHVVEGVSKRVEQDSDQVQTFIRKTRVTSTTT